MMSFCGRGQFSFPAFVILGVMINVRGILRRTCIAGFCVSSQRLCKLVFLSDNIVPLGDICFGVCK